MKNSNLTEMFQRWIPWVRLLLVPLLVLLFAQYLEGPPYRVIVRSFPFIITVVAVSAFAGEIVWRLKPYPPVLGLVYTIIVSAGFIWSAQSYYEGGKNRDYLFLLVFWSILMGLNLALCLSSLHVPFKRRGDRIAPAQGIGSVDHYDVRFYRLANDGGRLHLSHHLHGAPPLPEGFFVDGFSRDHFVSLKDYWATIKEQRLHRFTTPVTLYETIIKFGETQQLVDHFELEIRVSFSGE